MSTTTTKGRSAKSARTASAKTDPHTVASRLPPTSPRQVEAARKKFEKGILRRGEAVEAGQPLPAGATHEIVGRRQDGSPLLKRKRFSAR